MPTSTHLMTVQKVKICSNCEHFEKKSYGIVCTLKKWTHSSGEERFFFNPHTTYVDRLKPNLEIIWEHGVECNDYKGNEFVITDMSVTHETEEHPFTSGEIGIENIGMIFDVTIREIGVAMPSTSDTRLKITEDSKLYEWIKNLTL